MTLKRDNITCAGEEISPFSEKVREAAMWLADQPSTKAPVVPALRTKFDLTALEACRACELANRFRTVRRAFG